MAIAAMAAECRELFQRILRAVEDDTLRLEWKNRVFQFNIWSANNFIRPQDNFNFAPRMASMDWRLRNAPLLEEAMVELLKHLRDTLAESYTTIKNPTTQHSLESYATRQDLTTQHSPDSYAARQEIIKHSLKSYATIKDPKTLKNKADTDDPVSEALEELFRLSRAVRRSGMLHGFVKVASYVEYDDDGINITEEFRKGAERIVEFRLKHSRASQNLRKRILDSICLRQQLFAYLRANKQKRHRSRARIETDAPSFLRVASAASKAQSVTRSPVEDPDDPDDLDDLPPPPSDRILRIGYFGTYRCPYCFFGCRLEEFSGERWKEHIIQDIMPYVCVLEPCPAPIVLFESEKGWLDHMRNQHSIGQWACMDSSHKTTFFFDTNSAFKDHMHQYHLGQFHDDNLDDIAAACYQRLPVDNVITDCPFCPPTARDADLDIAELIKHVAAHLFSLAQISLRGHIDGDFGQSQTTHSGWTLGEVSIAQRMHIDFPDSGDEGGETHEEYAHRSPDEGIPDGDADSFHNMWRHVRESLHLPLVYKTSFKREEADWRATFNPEVERTFDVQLVHHLGHRRFVTSVCFSPDGKYLATACQQEARIFDVESGLLLTMLEHRQHEEKLVRYVQSVCFSPDGTLLATGADDCLVRVWHLTTEKTRYVMVGHSDEVCSVDFARSGQYIASGSQDGSIHLWDLDTGTPVRVLRTTSDVHSLSISPDGCYLAAGCGDGTVQVWMISTGALLQRLQSHSEGVRSVSFAPKGCFLVSGGLDRTIKTWLLDPAAEHTTSDIPMQTFTGHKASVNSVRMTPDSKWILSGSGDGIVHFWDPETGTSHMQLEGHNASVTALAACPTGRLFATADWRGCVRIWSYSSYTED